MAKYYVLKVRGTWLAEEQLAVSPHGADEGYFVGQSIGGEALVARKQYMGMRYTKKMKREIRKEAGATWPAHMRFVPLSTKATRLKKRAQNSLLNEGEDGTVYLHLKPNTWHSVEADIVLDVLAEAGF